MPDENYHQPKNTDEKARALVEKIYESWEYIGRDENGTETYLPLRKKAINLSKATLKELKAMNTLDSKVQEHMVHIKKVLKSAMRRKMRVSWKVVAAVLVFLAFWVFQTGVLDPPGERFLNLDEAQLKAEYNKELARYKEYLRSTVEDEIPETRQRVENAKKNLAAGTGDKEELEKAEKWLKSLEDKYLVQYTDRINLMEGMTPEQYRDFYIEEDRKDQFGYEAGIGVWLFALLMYFITSRRPYFLFWRKSYNDGTLNTIDDIGGAIVSASLISSLVNFDRNSTEYIKWSDGTVTRHTDLTGGGIGIIFTIVIAMFYLIAMVLSLPLRIIWDLLRNYIFYF